MADFWETLHGYLLSWNSLVKNFKTRLQNFADRLSLAVAIMICTNSPLQDKRGKGCIKLIKMLLAISKEIIFSQDLPE